MSQLLGYVVFIALIGGSLGTLALWAFDQRYGR